MDMWRDLFESDDAIRSRVTHVVTAATEVLNEQVFACAPRVTASQLIQVRGDCQADVRITGNTMTQNIELKARCLSSLEVTPEAERRIQEMVDDLVADLTASVLKVEEGLPLWNAVVDITSDLSVSIINRFRIACTAAITSDQAVDVLRVGGGCGEDDTVTIRAVDMAQFSRATVICMAQSSVVTETVKRLVELRDKTPEASRRVVYRIAGFMGVSLLLLAMVVLGSRWWRARQALNKP